MWMGGVTEIARRYGTRGVVELEKYHEDTGYMEGWS